MSASPREVAAVLVETFRACLGLGILLVGSALEADEVRQAALSVNISVYDDAGVGLETAQTAAEEATRIFGQAGLETHWFLCGEGQSLTHVSAKCGKAAYPTNLTLRIVRRSRGLKAAALGISYLSAAGLGCYSDVFLEPMEELQRVFQGSLANLLGHVEAHEIAHLLLGANSHSAAGIMRAHWQREDLENAEKGRLLFSKAEGEVMIAHLAAVRPNEETPVVAAALRTGAPTILSLTQKRLSLP
jgi:hypothetical protein